MRRWYRWYWAQTWYRNTYLVNRPEDIGRTTGNHPEWNNIHDSGCHFTCLAMIVGIDPARLASELRDRTYFLPDESLPAKLLNPATSSEGLVWDQNAPHKNLRSISIENLWNHQFGRRVSITLSYVGRSSTDNYESANARVSDVRSRGNHLICGPADHSYLVAGNLDGEYFLWDPDGSATSVEQNLQGRMTLQKLFRTCRDKKIELWEYSFVVA